MNVNGLSIAYQVKGQGSPLVMLHGGVSDSRSWNRQLERFSDEFRVIAWDAPGCGGSQDPPEDYSLEDYADTLAEFIYKMGLRQAHILGLSFGGGLAIQLYQRHPTIARTLILESAYAGWTGSLPANEVEERRKKGMEMSQMTGKEVADAFIPTLFSDSVPKETVEETASIIRDFHPSGSRTMLSAFARADLRDTLPEITIPVLLIYGDRDKRSPLKVARDLHSRMPSSKLVIIPGAGHVVHEETPDRFENEVREFLLSVSRSL